MEGAASVLRLADIDRQAVALLLARYGLALDLLSPQASIPGSYWGDAEAGLKGDVLHARPDTPLHSVLHEAAHYICMTPERRAGLDRDAGGDDAEECAVCWLQIALTQQLADEGRVRGGRERAFADMDAWGYSFRLGNTREWFERDADDARDWLRAAQLIDEQGAPHRQAAVLSLQRIAAPLLVLAALGLAGCTRISFAVANFPALFTPRISDVPFGDGARDHFDIFPASPESKVNPSEPRPLIVFFYGGNFTAGDKADYRFVGAALARTGHVTVLPDYRLYPEATFPAFVEDAARAVVAAQAQAARYGADSRRVVLAGHSAGAFIAAQLAFEPRWLSAAGGDPASVVGFIGLSGPYDLDPNSPGLEAIFDAVSTPDVYRPLRRVRAGAPPTLLLHGAKDDIVGVSHSEKLAAALRAVNTPVTLEVYPGRGHADTVAALSVPARKRTGSLQAISAFLRERDAAARPAGASEPSRIRP